MKIPPHILAGFATLTGLVACGGGDSAIVARSITSPTDRAAAFYVGAHPDDIELFMGRNAAYDIYNAQDSRKVFIVTTAGDAGLGAGNGENNLPFWRARQTGHEYAVLFWYGLTGKPGPTLKKSTATIAGKTIERRYFSDEVVMYNLMLPDGNPRGTGYAGTGTQSLSMLWDGTITSISAVDGSNSYTADSLKALIAGIVKLEAPKASGIRVHLVETATSANPGDHADHAATSRFFQSVLAAADFSCASSVYYATYGNHEKARNLPDNEVLIHVGAWGALNTGLQAGGQITSFESGHNLWLGKQYVTRTTPGTAACRF